MIMCKKCEKEKKQELFVKNKRYKSGYEPTCKECYNDNKKKYLNKNRERVRENNLRWYYKYHNDLFLNAVNRFFPEWTKHLRKTRSEKT